MSDQNYLYTVTGLREPFYAVVDAATGRAWTAPTKDGAVRQAREAGIHDFAEKTITRETFLRSLGIDVDPRPRPPRDPVSSPPAPQEPPAANTPGGTWFVPERDSGHAHDDFTLAGMKPVKQWASSPPVSSTPFAASAPIPPPSDEVIAPPDDVLILPSTPRSARRKNPFTDKPPALPDDLLD